MNASRALSWIGWQIRYLLLNGMSIKCCVVVRLAQVVKWRKYGCSIISLKCGEMGRFYLGMTPVQRSARPLDRVPIKLSPRLLKWVKSDDHVPGGASPRILARVRAKYSVLFPEAVVSTENGSSPAA
jgi:hypothetical protein